MLKTLSIQNFTVFSNAEISFSPGINVIIGQNGAGKTHLLKLAYLFNRAWVDLILKTPPYSKFSKKTVEVYFEDCLMGLFQPNSLVELIRWGNAEESILAAGIEGLIPTTIIATKEELEEIAKDVRFPFGHMTDPLSWSLSICQKLSSSQDNVLVVKKFPDESPSDAWVPWSTFIPSKEILSWYEGLPGLLSRYELKLDITYKHLADAIGLPKLSSPPSLLSSLLAELEKELSGTLQFENSKLIFVNAEGRRTSIPMMAEGFRKLALLPYLIQHGGVIRKKGQAVFWDEPEANLNPYYIRWMAKALVALAQEGVQVLIATHSLFLLREIDMLTKTGNVPARYISLTPTGNEVTVEQADDIELIQSLASLEAELEQNDQIQAWYAESM